MKGVKGFVKGHKHSDETKDRISKALSQKIKFICDMCKVECADKPSSYNRKNKHFCSRACYSDYRINVMMPHEQNSYKGGGMCDSEKKKRIKARSDLNHAVRSGKIVRDSCEHCGGIKTEAHHADYNKSLEVIWLCDRCHHKEHKKAKTYKINIVNGK